MAPTSLHDRPAPSLSHDDGQTLLHVAAESVRYGLIRRQPLTVNLLFFAPLLRLHRATFVTLHLEGQLRGCIGALEAVRPLVDDVAVNAFNAAFGDPRFGPVTHVEVDRLEFHISILSPPKPMTFTGEADLLAQLRPGVDGLILEAPGPAGQPARRGTFLPAVWETVPQPEDFLRHLKIKAGLPADHWSDALRVSRYTAESVG